jgi:hypothetical protein
MPAKRKKDSMFLRNVKKLLKLIPFLSTEENLSAVTPTVTQAGPPLGLRNGSIHPALFQGSKTRSREERLQRDARWRTRRQEAKRIPGVLVS